jgi:Protein of unknown function (DUF2800)
MAKHSEFSASGASRSLACPGSVRACHGLEGASSRYADEGTAAHDLAARCLVEGHDARHFVGLQIGEFTVDRTMADFVQVHVDTCRRARADADVFLVEHQFTLDALSPPLPMFGTADCVIYSKSRRELQIIDLKYGKGVWVPARNNSQLKYYAIGACLAIDDPVSTIVMTVVQPRVSGDPIRSATIGAIELVEWSFELLAAAAATQAPDAPLVAGTHCKFCPAQTTCLAFQNAKYTAACQFCSRPGWRTVSQHASLAACGAFLPGHSS